MSHPIKFLFSSFALTRKLPNSMKKSATVSLGLELALINLPLILNVFELFNLRDSSDWELNKVYIII